MPTSGIPGTEHDGATGLFHPSSPDDSYVSHRRISPIPDTRRCDAPYGRPGRKSALSREICVDR